MNEPAFAEDINYWRTSKSSPDQWIDRAIAQIVKAGGTVLMRAFGDEIQTGRSAYLLGFELDSDRFKLTWPVLPTRGGDHKAARRQAATMLYHHVKGLCVSSAVLGGRTAFFAHLMLPDGRAVAEAHNDELSDLLPSLFQPGAPRLTAT